MASTLIERRYNPNEFMREDAVVFIMRPANVFTTDEGIVIPVDCIPVRLPPSKREFFERF